MKNHPRPKRWAYANTKLGKREITQNNNLEAVYHRIINVVKTLYMKPGDGYFERDYKNDKSVGLLSMHAFLTPSFSWCLDCEFGFAYKITFAFGNCPYEQPIRKLFRAYPFCESTTEVTFQPNVESYYHRVQAYQSPEHFYTIP